MSPGETDIKSGKRKGRKCVRKRKNKGKLKLNVEKFEGEGGGDNTVTGKRGMWGINIYISR